MALVKLFSRPYWQRVWTMQETALAKNLYVLFGTKTISWTDLVGLIQIMLRAATGEANNALRTIGIFVDLLTIPARNRGKYRKKAFAGERISLLPLVLDAHAALVTNLRDRMYGFLGLATDAQNLVPKLDYRLSIVEEYMAFTKGVITTSRNLRVICLFQTWTARRFQLPGHEVLHLSCWAPD